MGQQDFAQLHERIDEIIVRMQKIQRQIRASRQPAAQYEIAELKKLGEEYGSLVATLESAGGDQGAKHD